MFTAQQLGTAFNDTLSIVNFKSGFDTFKFRKGFESDFELSKKQQDEILDYLKSNIQKENLIYRIVKSQIDNQEFLSTDYYTSPYSRKFRGAYSSVVYKTVAGIMALSL